MAKNRNKGFSLIEVIIGVAVLTILLTPVVKQLAQTMRTNRLAKEQQYANESAADVLEYAQKISFTDLKDSGNYKTETESTKESNDIYITSASGDIKRKCDVYIKSSTGFSEIGDCASLRMVDNQQYNDSNLAIDYTVTTYTLNSAALGSRRTVYDRTLILDDLYNKLSATTYKSSTNPDDEFGLSVFISDADTDPLGSLADAGFEYTSEGSIVQYTTDDDGTYISGIVCSKKSATDTVVDPNKSLLGSMTDLDSTQVALVNGDISKFDKQAQDDMYAAGLAYLKENNPSTYDQALSGHYDDGDGVLQQYGYTSNLKKTVTITIDQNTTDAYYLVSVDVNYTSALADKDSNGNVTSIIDTISLEYNVFSQKFYYDKEKTTPSVPSVYIEYQPFTFDGVDYAASEYIFVENYVDGAKVYLYQPAKDLSYAKNNGGTVDPDEVASSTGSYKQNSLSNSDKVNIQINTLVKSDADKTTQGKTTYIYTNLVETSEVDGTIVRSIDMSNQFNLSKINANDSIYGATEYAAFDNINTDAAYDPSKTTLFLKDVQDDKTTTDRLYTATVIVSPRTENANTVTLTGAKGGQ